MGSVGTVSSQMLDHGVILTTMSGFVAARVARGALHEFSQLLAGRRGARWIIDVTEITGFEARTVSVGAEWYEAFAQARGRRILFVASHKGARSVAKALGWGARTPVDHYTNRAAALESLGDVVGA